MRIKENLNQVSQHQNAAEVNLVQTCGAAVEINKKDHKAFLKPSFLKDFHVIKTIIVIFFIIVIYPYYMLRNLYADHDNSLRIDQNYTLTIDDHFQLINYMFQQFNKNISDYSYIELGTGLQYQTPLTWLSFLVYYQQSYSKGDDNTWLLEQKPSINMNTSVILSHFKISNQIRYEYRITTEWHDFRIKNYLVISLHDIFLHPYIGWELYYEDQDKDIMLHRIRFGIINKVYSNIYLGTFYRIDFSKIESHWEFSRQLIGIQIAIKFLL